MENQILEESFLSSFILSLELKLDFLNTINAFSKPCHYLHILVVL
jgi:hypothetical protein